MAVNNDADAYFAEANRWEYDRAEALRLSARRAWLVATGSAVAALLSTGAVALLGPLKRVEPFVIRVDSSTGIVDVVPGYAGTEALPEVVTRYLVTQYVVHRERYLAAIAEADYEQVGAYHNAAMNQSWATAWARTNPDSPLNRYADGTQVSVQVQSVTFLRHKAGLPDLVQVRFRADTERGNSAPISRLHYVATLQAAYGPPSSDDRVRSLNPLGLKVLEYRREPEASETVPPAATPVGSVAVGGESP